MRSVRGARVAGTMVLGAAILVAGGCGYKNPPVPPESIVPNAIEDLRYTVEDDAVNLTWTYPMETIKGTEISAISSFDLFRAEIPLEDYCPTCPVPFSEPIEVEGGETVLDDKQRVASYKYDMLRSGHKYFFKVQSRTGWWASSADSNIITFVWYEQSAAPTGLQATGVDSGVKLSWQPVSTYKDGKEVDGDVHYQVLRKSGSGDFARLGAPVKGTKYTDSGLKNGQEYSYKVQSIMLYGEDMVDGAVSNAITVKPVDTTPPPVPTGALAIETGSGIRLIWDSSMDDDTAAYRIYRRTSTSGKYTKIGTVKVPSTSFIDSDAKEEVRYYYSVTAIDNSSPPNESTKSKEATLRH